MAKHNFKIGTELVNNTYLPPPKLSGSDALLSVFMPALALGPTLIPSIGLRSEHISIMLFSIFALAQSRFKIKSALSYLCLGVALFFFLSALYTNLVPSFIFFKEEFNVLKFFLVFTPICYFFSSVSPAVRKHYFSRVMKIYFCVVALNFGLQLANMLGYGVEIAAYFAGTGDEVSTLWKACYGQGRYIGAFFQPANQGFFTGLFLICATWIWEKSKLRWVAFSVASLSIFLGTSKVGLCALFIAAILLLRKRPIYIFPLGVLILMFSAFLQWGTTNGITGLELQFLDPGKENSLTSVTAGRLGENSTLTHAFFCVWNDSPILGLGPGELARNYSMPYDNDLLYAYANGGIFAFFAEICMFLALLPTLGKQHKHHALALFVFLCVSSLGIVVFSGNGGTFLLAVALSFLLSEQQQTIPHTSNENPIRY